MIHTSQFMLQMRLDDLFIKLDHTTVYGKLAGDPSAKLALCIHGWSQRNGWRTWEPLLRPLAEAGYCAVSIDMPGWGDSPAIDHLPLMGDRAVDVIVGVMNGLMQETAVLLGKSWGGGVAINTALAHPDRITHLALTAPAFRETERLKELTQPVLLAWAKDDPVIPYGVSDKFLQHAPQIERVSYESGGHSAATNNAADFAIRLETFLKS